MYRGKDYDEEIAILSRIFRKYSDKPVRTILDLGCGTGNHALRLAATGFEVVGVDRSADMLRIAEQKTSAGGAHVRWHHADLRDMALQERFDAVLMMFAVLGYQTENQDVLKALRTARRHLHTNGVLVGDVWYGPAVVAQRPGDRVRLAATNGTTFLRTSSSVVDTQRQVCRVDFRIWHIKDRRVLQESSESHSVRYFFPRELELLFEASGFRLLRLGAFPDFDRNPDVTDWNALIVAIAAP
jgi:SAM-dependent methyltransferase